MPVKINTYACEFRCGYTNTKKQTTAKHESRCFSNPANKACKTCKYFVSEEDTDGYHKWTDTYCKMDNFQESSKTNPTGFRLNCDKWRKK